MIAEAIFAYGGIRYFRPDLPAYAGQSWLEGTWQDVTQALGHLDDAWRIATPNTPIPYSPPLEDAFLPGPERIADEIRRRLR